MNVILFDTATRNQLFPLTLTRAVAGLRMGILTIEERWAEILDRDVFVVTDSYLQALYPAAPSDEYLFIDALVIPNPELIELIQSLGPDEAIGDENGLIAGRIYIESLPAIHEISQLFKRFRLISSTKRLWFPFDLFQSNSSMIQFDFDLMAKAKKSHETNQTVTLVNPSQIYIEEGVTIDYSVLNASIGPIYIGKNATVMEGCLIRGPFALCEGAALKMGAKIYGATTIGPYSIAGGEIKNSIISGYSNKAHDGYLGDSVIGEWCNMGAGTSNSNLKNTGGTVNLYNYSSNHFLPAGNKCGVIMGDYSRTAINSSINTGSVIGTCCHVFGRGLLPKFIPDFTWGSEARNRYQFQKAINDIENWKKMKNKTISATETQVLKHIFELSDNKDL